jgi:hypothetical protein
MRWLIVLLFWISSATAQVVDLPVRQELMLPTNIFKTVFVTGKGWSPGLARQDAFRQAIEQAAGIVIATETQSFNQQLTRDQIATYSQARIVNFAIVRQYETDHHWVCETWVTVRSACTQSTYSCTN